MDTAFYISAGVAVLATLGVVTRTHAAHALLYLVVSLLATAAAMWSLGAAFAAAVEVIVYAGAIMVVFIFVIMILNLTREAARAERRLLRPSIWVLPCVLTGVLLAEVVYVLAAGGPGGSAVTSVEPVSPKEVGLSLFGPYVLGVELASLLLLAAIVGVFHLARPVKEGQP